MPVTQSLQSSIFTASTGQSATLTFAVPAGKYNRGLNGFTVSSTHGMGGSGISGIIVDGGRYIRTISFNYTLTTPNSNTSGAMTLGFQQDVPSGGDSYFFSFGDQQNGVTLPNTLVLPDDFYKDLVGGCTVTLTLSPTHCTDIYNAQLGYHLLKSVVVGSFGYLPTSASPNPYPGTSFVCTDAPSEQALHFTGAIGIGILGDRGSPVFAAYPPYTFQWSDGSGKNPAQGQSDETHAKCESQQDTPYGPDASGNLVATSVATYSVTRDDPGINPPHGYPGYSSNYSWAATVTITDSDFVPNVWVLDIGDTPGRYCTMGASITIGPPPAAFAQYDKPAYTAQATGGFVEPLVFRWVPRYQSSQGRIVEGEAGYYAGSVVTNADSQTLVFADFNPPPPPPYDFTLLDVACVITDSDQFGPCRHVALASAVLTYSPPPPIGLATGAIVVDHTRQWLHQGANAAGKSSVVTTHLAGEMAFTGPSLLGSDGAGIDQWVRFRTDPRGGKLLLLGLRRVPATSSTPASTQYTLFLSTDGGKTAAQVITMSASSFLIEVLSERGAVVLMSADTQMPPNISVQQGNYSSDYLVFGAAVAATSGSGASAKPLTGTLLDMDYDARTDTLYLLTDGGPLRSKDVGLTWNP